MATSAQGLKGDAGAPAILAATERACGGLVSALVRPIQIGSADAPERLPRVMHDDDGANISDFAATYRGLTAQYWAWRNLTASFYGFCSCDLWFSFAARDMRAGDVMGGRLGAARQLAHGMTSRRIRAVLGGHDAALVRRRPTGGASVRAWYVQARHLTEDDLARAQALVEDVHPNYAEEAALVLGGAELWPYGMYVMRDGLFQDYCAWLFPVVDAWVASARADGHDPLRQEPWYLSEVLLNVFCLRQQRVDPLWRPVELPALHAAPPRDLRGRLRPTPAR